MAFQAEMVRRKEALAQINDDSTKQYAECRRHWDGKRRVIEKMPMLKHNRQRVRLELKKREQAELDKLRADAAAKRLAVRTEIPYTSWNKCLQHKAAQGDETAVAILRSKKAKVQPEQIGPPPDKAPCRHQPDAQNMIVVNVVFTVERQPETKSNFQRRPSVICGPD